MDDLKVRLAVLEVEAQTLRSDIATMKGDIRALIDVSRQVEGRLSALEAEIKHKPTHLAMWIAAVAVTASLLAWAWWVNAA
jgi:hypothetical protein